MFLTAKEVAEAAQIVRNRLIAAKIDLPESYPSPAKPAAVLAPAKGAKPEITSLTGLAPDALNHRVRDEEWFNSLPDLAEDMIINGYNPKYPVVLKGEGILGGTRRIAAYTIAREVNPALPDKIPAFDVESANLAPAALFALTYDRGDIVEGMGFRDDELLTFAWEAWEMGASGRTPLARALRMGADNDKLDKFTFPLCQAREVSPIDGKAIFDLAIANRRKDKKSKDYTITYAQTKVLRKAMSFDMSKSDHAWTRTRDTIRYLTTLKGWMHLQTILKESKGKFDDLFYDDAAVAATEVSEGPGGKPLPPEESIQEATAKTVRSTLRSPWMQVLTTPTPSKYSADTWKVLKAKLAELNALCESKEKGIKPSSDAFADIAEFLFFAPLANIEPAPAEAIPAGPLPSTPKQPHNRRDKPAIKRTK